MNNFIQIANVLLTRRCNLKCSYCQIVRTCYDNDDYPEMDYYWNHELSSDKWIDIFSRLKKNNPNIFYILYGGETFLYDHLSDILTWMHLEKCNYTIITNNTDEIQNRIQKVLNAVGKFKGFTSSVDPVLLMNPSNSDIYRKSKLGFERLCKAKREGIADDVVAEITATSKNLPYLYQTIKLLSENNIYSSITVIDDKKSKYYDFSNVKDKTLLLNKNQEVKDTFVKIQNDKSLLVHIPELLDDLYNILPSNMKCSLNKEIGNVTIDSDGSFRLCLRIRGTECTLLKWDKVISVDGEFSSDFIKAFNFDYSTKCLGCNHTCLLMSEKFSSGIIDH